MEKEKDKETKKKKKSKGPEIYILRELYNLRFFRMFVYYFIFYASLTSITELITYFIQSHVSNSSFDHAWLDRGVC